MNKFYHYFLAMVSLLLVTNIPQALATKRKVLFIGNSYIYTNNMPQLLQQLATSMKDTLEYDQNTPGGYTLELHSTDATTINKIYAQNWDVVLVQEQSQRPAFDPSQVQTDTYPYARKIDSMINDNYACSETLFMMTWGYKNGDAGNCPFYPPICTYGGMQNRLRESYLEMADNNNANTAPVGAAWKMVRDSFPTIDLYSPDNSHPSLHGSYLEACVLYASMFHKNPLGSSYIAGLPAADAEKLQRIAGRIVLDSIGHWQQHGNYAFSRYSYTKAANTVTFQNKSQKATTYYWNFGDGTNSTSTTPPAKTYTANGKYAVSLTASNSCHTESYIDTITIGPVNVTAKDLSASVQILQHMGGQVVMKFPVSHKFTELLVLDMSGRKVIHQFISLYSQVKLQLHPGVYTYLLKGDKEVASGKLSVY
jgi:hypothetical protein